MPKKEEESPLIPQSPLQVAVKEGDAFKKQVDEFVKECQDVLKDTDLEKSAIAVKNLYKRSNDLLEEHGRLQRQADELKKENEPSKVMRFDSKRKDEIKRLEKQREKIDKLNKQLEPDEVEEEYLSKVSKGAEAEESEEETDSEEEESEEDAPPPKPSTSKQKVVRKTQAQEEEEEEEEEDEDDLDLETEDEDEDDDEEEEDSEEETEEEDSEEEEEDTEGAAQQNETMRQFVALQDYDAQQDGDLGFSAGDILTITNAREDGWLVAKDTEGNTGLVPSNFLKVYSQFEAEQDGEEEDSDEETDPKTPRSGRLLWKNIKRAVKETSVTDVLHAMGSLPAGFREATLGKMAAQDAYTMKNYLAPKLSPSCVSFRDLFFDASTNKIRARSVRIQRIVTVMVCRQIPLPGAAAGVEILSRHLRACLFDGKNVLSNIHTIRIQGLDKTQNTWNFNTKATETMKTLEFADFFIRTNSSEGNIGILFELGMTYIRTSTGQEGEFSCGWVHMPLFDTNGAPAQNKTYDLFVNGGTPYEKGVDVDPSVGRRDKNASTNLFRSLMSGNRQPRLNIRIQAPTKDQKDLLDTLPDVCVSSTAYIQYLSFYRQILTDAVIRDCVEPRSTDLIHNPLLASFPSIADQPDLMDVLRVSWAERLKTAKRSEKKDSEALKQLYIKLFMDTVYPLLHSASIPALKFGATKVEEERLAEIQRLQKLSKEKKTAGAILLSADTSYTPFDTCEMAFNVLGPHCVSRQ